MSSRRLFDRREPIMVHRAAAGTITARLRVVERPSDPASVGYDLLVERVQPVTVGDDLLYEVVGPVEPYRYKRRSFDQLSMIDWTLRKVAYGEMDHDRATDDINLLRHQDFLNLMRDRAIKKKGADATKEAAREVRERIRPIFDQAYDSFIAKYRRQPGKKPLTTMLKRYRDLMPRP